MQTADWALVISVCSAAVSLLSLGWNIWSKFIYPKPKVAVSFAYMIVMGGSRHEDDAVLALQATNHGPGPVTLHSAIVRAHRGIFRRKGWGLLNPLSNWPMREEISAGPFGRGLLPTKIDVGETFTAHFIPDHESLAGSDIVRIGFSDTFGRNHWAPRKSLHKARPSIRKACEQAGKSYKR